MAIDRAAALRNAEKLVRQGKLDQAIAEYLRVVEDQPRDWNTANTLGDLYVRAAQSDRAIEQFTRIADGLREEGFLSKAAALYKKILKIKPDDEHAQLQAAEIAAAQGVLVDARSYLNAVADRRRQRGDRRGAAAVVVRLGSLDPGDWDARRLGARAMVELDDVPGAVSALKRLAADLIANGREDRGVDVLEEAARLDPNDGDVRVQLFRTLAQRGDVAAAAAYLPAEGAQDPQLFLSLAEVHLRAGRVEEALALVDRVIATDPTERHAIVALAVAVGERDAAAGYAVADHVVDRLAAEQDWPAAAAVLETFLSQVPHHVPALLRLVEVSFDGGLHDVMSQAQARLSEAHLARGFAREARFIAEDLVIRNPHDAGHLDRLRRALLAIGEVDVDRIIADCLSGQAPLVESGDPMSYEPASDTISVPEAPVVANPVLVVEEAVSARLVLGNPKSPSSSPAQHRTENTEIDLSVMLDQMQKPPTVALEPMDLDDVFARMREQARTRLAIDSAEQDFRKGVALFKAGQIDESIPALEAASRAPRFRFETAGALGRIFLGRGDLPKAVEWLERGAEAPAPSAEDRHILLYDLADALQSLGETTRALAVYLELQADAGFFRDVRSRIDRLAKAQARG